MLQISETESLTQMIGGQGETLDRHFHMLYYAQNNTLPKKSIQLWKIFVLFFIFYAHKSTQLTLKTYKAILPEYVSGGNFQYENHK